MRSNRPRRRPMARLVSALVNVSLLMATLAGVAYLAPSLLGLERYVITGGSMSGTFEKGSVAFEKPVPVQDLAVGDVITYQPPADSGVPTLVTHRIITIKDTPGAGRQFQTKGDANPDPDPWKFQLVRGDQPVVQHTVPYAGWVFIGLADRTIRMLVIGIPAALVALFSLVELASGIRTARRTPRTEKAPEAPRDEPSRDVPAGARKRTYAPC